MSDQLKTMLEDPGSGPKLIMDAEAYAQQVLLQGKAIPWHDATAYSNHLGQAVALLKPQVAVIAMDKMMATELAGNQTLVDAMGAKKRSGFALKAFMGDENFKAAAGALVTTVAKTLHLPIVVQLPSPLAILYLTARAALDLMTTMPKTRRFTMPTGCVLLLMLTLPDSFLTSAPVMLPKRPINPLRIRPSTTVGVLVCAEKNKYTLVIHRLASRCCQVIIGFPGKVLMPLAASFLAKLPKMRYLKRYWNF